MRQTSDKIGTIALNLPGEDRIIKDQQISLPTGVFGDLQLREGDVIEGTTAGGIVQIRIVSRSTESADRADRLSNEQLLALAKKHSPPSG